MLAGLRNAAKSKFAVPVIVVLALSFAVWGVNDAFQGGARDAVATVGPEKVTLTEFSRRFNQQVSLINQQQGQTFTSQDAREAGLDQQVLNQMIAGAAMDAKADDLGLGVSDQLLSEEIRSIPAFQDQIRGQFSRDAYISAIAQLEMGPEEFERAIAGDIVRQQLLDAVSAGDSAPEILARNRAAYAAETRTADVLVLPPALVGDIEEPGDAELQQILDDNQEAFTQPERRALTVVWMDPARMQQAMQIDEQELADLYEFRKESLSTPGWRSFVQISVADEAAANEAAERLAGGEPAEAVAQAYDSEAIVQEQAPRDQLVEPALAEAVFSMSAEDAPKAVEGRFGWTVVDVTAVQEAQMPSLEEVEQELRTELAADRAQEMVYEALNQFEDARGAGASLEAAAREAGLVAQSYLPIDQRGYTEEGLAFNELAAAQPLMEAVFNLASGGISDLVDLDERGFAVARVDRIVDERRETLDSVRDTVEAVWRSRELGDRLSERAEAIAERARAGESLSSIAAGIEGVTVERLILKRGQTAGGAGPRMTAALFDAEQGAVVTANAGQSGQAVGVLRDITIDQAAADQGADQIASELGDDLLYQFQTALNDEYEVRTYPDQVGLALGDAPAPQ